MTNGTATGRSRTHSRRKEMYYGSYVFEKLAGQIHQERISEARRHQKYMKARKAMRDVVKSITAR
jgi:hypothetical protein